MAEFSMTGQEIKDIVGAQRIFFDSGATRSYAFRIEQLNKLRDGIRRYEKDFSAALKADLGKPEFEAYMTEIGFVLNDISYTLKRLKKWMRPRKISTPILVQPGSSRIHFSPLGVNLIISPFNYPLGMTFGPLTAALAAGNTAVLKTSELTPESARMMQKLVEDIFPPELVAYVPGEVEETRILLEQHFDHIFFTGSPRIGSIIMRAAADKLIPVTLELGGKTPCVVHGDAKLELAAKRIVFGKFMNAGQTCVAPDYLLVHKSVKAEFIKLLKERINKIFGDDPEASPDYGRIVSEKHFDRISALMDSSKIIAGGGMRRESRFIAPTLMDNVSLDDPVMGEEIFGPVLPVLEYETLEEVASIIGKLPKHPLACYVYSQNRTVQNAIMENIQFGGGCINHCIQHLVNPELPFGGVGCSGMGRYHGFEGFKCFSHQKSVFKAATFFDLPLIYPPYAGKLNFIRWMMK